MYVKTYRKIKRLCGLQNKIELPDLVIDSTDHTNYDGGVIQSDGSVIMKTNIDKVINKFISKIEILAV